MIVINISKCPITGLDRKVTYKQLLHNVDSQEIKIKVEVNFLVEAKGLVPIQMDLTADNSTQVNPQTGEFLAPGDSGVGQYDFIIAAMQSGIDPFMLIQSHMVNADVLGRYN